jgi:acyl-CoA thioester hydrolase
MAGPAPYEYPVAVRYLEVDQQGVVFNAWYLAYFDEAFTGYLAHHGISYRQMIAEGDDVQLVHTELDWFASLRYGDQAAVVVRPEKVGTTSFTMLFEVVRAGARLCRGRTVYVAVGVDGSGKRPIPARLRAALESGAPGIMPG